MSGLKRKTPLKSKGSSLRRTPFKKKRVGQSCAEKEKEPSRGAKCPYLRRTKSNGSPTERLDRVFSLFIRLRDAMYGGMTQCVSCNKILPFAQMQCGHFFTRHNMSVRWDERNCHSQCAECNEHKSGNIDAYRIRLEQKIGAEELQRLAYLHNQTKKWEDDEIERLIRFYTSEARRLAKEKGITVKI